MMYLRQGITENIQQQLKQRYRCDNWRDWALQNWGADWNNTPNRVTFCRGKNTAIWEFWSPGGPPKPVYDKLRELYPEVDIEWWYGGPEMPDSGWLWTDLNSELIDNDMNW